MFQRAASIARAAGMKVELQEKVEEEEVKEE